MPSRQIGAPSGPTRTRNAAMQRFPGGAYRPGPMRANILSIPEDHISVFLLCTRRCSGDGWLARVPGAGWRARWRPGLYPRRPRLWYRGSPPSPRPTTPLRPPRRHLTIWRLNRLGRSLTDLVEIVTGLGASGSTEEWTRCSSARQWTLRQGPAALRPPPMDDRYTKRALSPRQVSISITVSSQSTASYAA
jgi:hypothetical protein